MESSFIFGTLLESVVPCNWLSFSREIIAREFPGARFINGEKPIHVTILPVETKHDINKKD